MIGIATKFAPTPASFETASRAGFRRAELWTDADVLLGHEEVARLAKTYPFEYAVHFPNRLAQPPEVVEAAARLCGALGARALIMHQPHQDRHAEALRQLLPGIPLAVENHRLTPAGFVEWATKNDGLTLDVEHLWMFTLAGASLGQVLAEMRTFLERFGTKLRHVHLPGHWPGTGEHRPMYCSRDLVRGVWDLLDEFRFAGLIVSEVNNEFQNLQDLSMDVLLFERWQQEHAERAAASF